MFQGFQATVPSNSTVFEPTSQEEAFRSKRMFKTERGGGQGMRDGGRIGGGDRRIQGGEKVRFSFAVGESVARELWRKVEPRKNNYSAGPFPNSNI